MKTKNVIVYACSTSMDLSAVALLIQGRYSMAEILSITEERVTIKLNLRYLSSLLSWAPKEIDLETQFKKGDIVLHFPSSAYDRAWWGRVHEVWEGLAGQMLSLRSPERFPGARWVEGSTEWAEARVRSTSCMLKRRSQ